MYFYNWREMIAWIAIFAIGLAVILVGIQSSGGQSVLRLAAGPQDSFQHQAGLELKRLIERSTPYQVVLAHHDDSMAGQRLLLEGKVDAALLAPAALSGGIKAVAAAPVGSLYAHLLLDRKSKATSLYQLQPEEIGMGGAGTDQPALGRSILRALGVEAPNALLAEGEGKAPGNAHLVVDHFLDSSWPQLLSGDRYRLATLREATAVSLNDPLWVPATIPAFIHSKPEYQLPAEPTATLATPLVLAVLPETHADLVADLVALLNGPEGRALMERFHQPATEQAWQLLAKHAAAGGEALPVRELLRQELAWWLEHKLLVALILAGLALILWQTRNLRKSRRLAQVEALRRDVEGMLSQLLTYEQRARTEVDLRGLHQLLDEVNHLKIRGSKLMLGTELARDPILVVFHQQCNHLCQLLEARLQGKSSLAAAA